MLLLFSFFTMALKGKMNSGESVTWWDMFIGAVIYGFLFTIPSFYGMYILLERL